MSHTNKTNFSLFALVLAIGYSIYQFINTDYAAFGLHFRYLTIWGLTLAMVCHGTLWIDRRANQNERFLPFIAASAVLNIMVMYLYWKLYFTDPSLVNGENSPVWFQEYYLHLLGPLLIVFDALFLSKAARHIRGLMYSIVICLAYVAWSEILVGPLNDKPVGSVTSGLPYPFLNNMDIMGRATFYGSTIALAIGVFVALWIISFIARKLSRAT